LSINIGGIEMDGKDVIFCVMKSQGVLFAIYRTREKAENVADRMRKKYMSDYYVETRAIL
jgi:hypothetical protein